MRAAATAERQKAGGRRQARRRGLQGAPGLPVVVYILLGILLFLLGGCIAVGPSPRRWVSHASLLPPLWRLRRERRLIRGLMDACTAL